MQVLLIRLHNKLFGTQMEFGMNRYILGIVGTLALVRCKTTRFYCRLGSHSGDRQVVCERGSPGYTRLR